MPHLNNYSLDSLNFPRGILVFLLGLVFFLGSTEQYKAMKIGITFFGSKLDLLCISKVLTIFCVFSKIRLQKKRSRGHVACSPSARGSLSVWGSRAGALGELPGGVLSARPRGTRGGLGSIRGILPAGYPGTRGAIGGSRGKSHSLDSRRTRVLPGGSAVNGYSGTGVALAGFSVHSGVSG